MPDARISRAAVSRSFMFHCIFNTFPTGQMENGEWVVFKVTTSNRGIPYVRDSTSSVLVIFSLGYDPLSVYQVNFQFT